MFFFKKKKASERKLYPSVYSEWIKEFKRLDTALIREDDATLLKGGALTDSKYSIGNYKRELTSFLQKQLSFYINEVSDVVSRYVEENDYEYLMLMIRRYHLRYKELYFFSDFKFLDDEFKEDLKNKLTEKSRAFDEELIRYFDEISKLTDSMSEVSTNIRRLIEV